MAKGTPPGGDGYDFSKEAARGGVPYEGGPGQPFMDQRALYANLDFPGERQSYYPGEPAPFDHRSLMRPEQVDEVPGLSGETVKALISSSNPDAPGATPASDSPTSGGSSGRASAMRGFRMNTGPVGSRLSNADFMPAGTTPNQARGTQVGKYGGAPLFAATIAAPFAVFDDRANALSRKQAEIDAARKRFNPYEGLNDPKALKYSDSLTTAAMDDIDAAYDSAVAKYGRDDATMKFDDQSSPESRALVRKTKHWNTVMANVDQAVESATAVLEGMDSGTLQMNPVLYQDAKEMTDRLGSWGTNDVEWLAENMPKLNAKVSLVDYMKKEGIQSLLKNAGSTQKVFELVKRGDPLYAAGFSTLLSKKTTDKSAIVDALTDHLEPLYKGDLTRDEIRKVVAGAASDLYEEDVERSAIPGYGSGGSGSKSSGSGVIKADSTVVPSSTVTGSGTAFSKTKGADGAEVYRPTLNLLDEVSDKGKLATVRELRDGGNTVAMLPMRIMNIDGKLFVIGKKTRLPGAGSNDANDPVSKLLAAQQRMAEGGGQVELSSIPEFQQLQDVAVPYDENESLMQEAFPKLSDDAWKKEMGYRGANKMQSDPITGKPVSSGGTVRVDTPLGDSLSGGSKPAKPAKSVYYDSESEPPPASIPAKWSAKHGAWLIQKRGGKQNEWVKVRR